MLKLQSLTAGYGESTILHDMNIEVNEGEIVTIIGANGAGKSTTLMTISGFVSVFQGDILFEDASLLNTRPENIVRKGIIQVPEGRRIFPDMSVKENLDMGALLRNDKQEIEQDCQHVYDLFPILYERRRQIGSTLSGGEQQMLAIGRGIMANPKLLLLDEPSLGLAPILVQQILGVIRRIRDEKHCTVLLVEQNANQALHISDRGYVLETGVIKISDKSDILLKNEEVKKAYLGSV